MAPLLRHVLAVGVTGLGLGFGAGFVVAENIYACDAKKRSVRILGRLAAATVLVSILLTANVARGNARS